MADIPSWHQLLSLIASTPKPPLRARVVESTPGRVREASVVHDGSGTWHITTEETTELSSPDSTTIVGADRFEMIRGMGVASNNWVKSLIQGRLIAYLTGSVGHVVDSDPIAGRACWIADIAGMKADQPHEVFRMWVDAETGIIMRLERADVGNTVVELSDVAFGTVIEGSPRNDL